MFRLQSEQDRSPGVAVFSNLQRVPRRCMLRRAGFSRFAEVTVTEQRVRRSILGLVNGLTSAARMLRVGNCGRRRKATLTGEDTEPSFCTVPVQCLYPLEAVVEELAFDLGAGTSRPRAPGRRSSVADASPERGAPSSSARRQRSRPTLAWRSASSTGSSGLTRGYVSGRSRRPSDPHSRSSISVADRLP